ncbi:MAG TPA: ribonuclease HI family protein [Chloroflexaceae bacterium]|nr:ribonuclease HI family protein [Chloroflexaceae bacterium]
MGAVSAPAVIVQVDGTPGQRPGGFAGIGVVVRSPRGEVLRTRCLRAPAATCVEAEYQAIIAGLDLALRAYPGAAVRCMSDSQVAVAQIAGRYAVRAGPLRPLHERAAALAARFVRLELVAIPRELNRLADALAWEALGGRGLIVAFQP